MNADVIQLGDLMVKAKWKMWPPRFSIRTLLLLSVLVALFFAANGATKKYGTEDATAWLKEHRTGHVVALHKGPLLVASGVSTTGPNSTVVTYERHYLWILGWVFELPWERKYVDKYNDGNSFNDIINLRLFGKQPSG